MTSTKVVRIAAFVVVLVTMPFTLTVDHGVRENVSCAQTDNEGDCCKELSSICNKGTREVQNAYYSTQGC